MSDDITQSMLDAILAALDLSGDAGSRVTFSGNDRLASYLPVSELAVASIGAAATTVSELVGLFSAVPPVSVSYRSASLWFGWSIQPMGWEMPSPWDSIAGDYKALDGWIKLHTNAPNHRAAALSVLDCEPTREAVAETSLKTRLSPLAAAPHACGLAQNGRSTRKAKRSRQSP